VRRALATGLDIEAFAPRLSFFFAAHNDLLEEVAKFRAARRLWATLLRDRHGASDRSCQLRFHTQTGGSTLTAQQPLNNVVRVTIQALAATLGGTQSLHTNGFDEALSLPTEEAAKLALRTQQVLSAESGVTRTADPLGGSHYVEALTDEIERRAMEEIEEIESLGGAAKGIAYMQDRIQEAAYRFQMQIESGERSVVGVNAHVDDEDAPALGLPDFSALERAQVERLAGLKKARRPEVVRWSLEQIRTASRSTENLLPPLIDAVKAGVTLGEISDALRGEWGTYDG
jgi:methylmalonyl-CoA mutase N-terminal domain/subunit